MSAICARWRLILALGGVLLLWIPAARAQTPRAKQQQARRWFEKAENHYVAREFRKALTAYKKAQTFMRHPAFLFNIAQCHRQLKEYAQALFYYKLYLSERPRAANRAEVKRFIKAMGTKAAAVKARRSVGKVSVISRPPGAEVRVDRFKGAAQAIAPAILTLAVGQHVIQISRAGYRTVYKTVTVVHGKMPLLEVKLPKIGVRPRPRLRPPPRPRRRVTPPPRRRLPPPEVVPRAEQPTPVYKRWWLWTGVSLSAALLATALYTGTQALALDKEWNEEIEPTLSAGESDPIQKRGKSMAVATDVLLGLGTVTLVATIIGAAVAASRNKAAERRARIVPFVGPTGGGLQVTGRY